MVSLKSSVFSQFKEGLLSIDPVYFCEKNLTLDGRPFRLNGNGYKPFADIYRYIGIRALEKNSKPIVLVKGRQVGATTMAAALELFFMSCGIFGTGGRAPMRVLHAFPLLDHAFVYTKTKLNPMITGAVPDEQSKLKGRPKSRIESKIDKSASANDSLQFKQFEFGNHIQIESTGLDANRLRGRTVDCIIFDECQDIARTAIVNATQILAKAQYGRPGRGIQVFFGTPKQKGTVYWDIWQNSNQQYYHLGCEQCGKLFPLYTPESNDWETIWIEDDLPPDHKKHGFIVKCTHCEFQQDKRDAAERGKWIPLRKEVLGEDEDKNLQFIGYHINQLYMPDIRREDIIAKKPENNVEYTERAYQNEVLGEFFAGDSSPLTPEEIKAFCSDPDRSFRKSISLSENKKVYLGCDWGDKVDMDQFIIGEREQKAKGQSYSAVVVISVDGTGLYNIEFAKLLKRNDFEYKKGFIHEIMRRYSITRAVGDIGHAGDISEVLNRDFGDRYLVSRAHGELKHHIKFIPDVFPPEIIFDKNYYVAEFIELVKRGKIRFPWKSYEQIGWLANQCSHGFDIKPTINRLGEAKINYIKGSIQNDGAMALINAILAHKFDSTDGFTNNDPAQARNVMKKQGIPAIAAYMPGLNSSNRAKSLNTITSPYRK